MTDGASYFSKEVEEIKGDSFKVSILQIPFKYRLSMKAHTL